jgi:Skp family chaperone for outer membrane proteins
MKKLNIFGHPYFLRAGWAVALACIGLLALGFQNSADKTGVVDMQKVIDQSDQGKSVSARLNAMNAARKGLLEFIMTQRVLTAEQSTRLRELWLKESPSDAEKAEMERIKKDVTTSAERYQALQQKPNPTQDDRNLLSEYTLRAQTMMQTVDRWANDFEQEMGKIYQEQNSAITDKAQAAVREAAKAQGFTVVFEARVAPYGANDLTEAAIKAMNAKK